MKNKKICQSCSMPLDEGTMYGTEKDGSANQTYCRYCYQNGAFTDSSLSLDGMRSVVSLEMKKRHIDTAAIEQALHILPNLKRWVI